MVASLLPVSALPQSPDGPGSRNLRAIHQVRVGAEGDRSGREPSASRTELPEPSVSCRSRSASKSRSLSLMGSTASPRRNSLLLSRILCISKVIRSWGVAQELSSKALPSIGQTVTGHKLPELLGIEAGGQPFQVSQATEAASLDVRSTARPPISHFESRHTKEVTSAPSEPSETTPSSPFRAITFRTPFPWALPRAISFGPGGAAPPGRAPISVPAALHLGAFGESALPNAGCRATRSGGRSAPPSEGFPATCGRTRRGP